MAAAHTIIPAAQSATQVEAAIEAGLLPHISGIYYDSSSTVGLTSIASGQAVVANTDYAMPFRALAPGGYDQISIDVTAAGLITTVGRMAVYTMGTDGLPAALVVDSGAVPVDAIATQTVTIAVPTVVGRWYWLLFNTNGAPSVQSYNGNASLMLFGYTSATSTERAGALTAARTHAAFPASLAGAPGWTRHVTPRAVRLRAV